MSPRPGSVAITCRSVGRRDHDHLARLDHPRRDEHAEAGQQVQLAQETASTVADDDPVLAVGVDDDVDGAGDDHEEVVGGIPLAEEVLAGGDRPSGSERLESGHLRVIERGERGGIVHE